MIGTHTHVPTADEQVLNGGTAYISDAGMCGDYDSVLGMNKEEPLSRFLTKIPNGRFQPALGEATITGVGIEVDDADDAFALRAGTPGSEILDLTDDLVRYAHELYARLRDADARGVRTIIAVLPPAEGLGHAIRDRLTKAAAPRSSRSG